MKKNMLKVSYALLWVIMFGFICHAEFVNTPLEIILCLVRAAITFVAIVYYHSALKEAGVIWFTSWQ